MKRHNCKYCGKYAGKSDTCRECKEKAPYEAAIGKGRPFSRQKALDKKNKGVFGLGK